MGKKEQSAFLLPKSQKEIIDELTNEEAGIIFKAIYEYEITKVEPKLRKTLKIVFKQFKIKLDLYDEAYEQKCIKNRENIEKRWAKLKNTNEYDRIQTNTIGYKKEKEKENKKENKNKNKKQNKNINIIKNNNSINNSGRGKTSVANATPPTLETVIEYGSNLNIDSKYCEKFYNHYESIGWVTGTGQKIKNWKLIFKNWIAKDQKQQADQKIKKVDEGVFKL